MKHHHKNAREIWYEGEDGWWAILKPNMRIDGCVGVHAERKKELMDRLNDAIEVEICPLCQNPVQEHNVFRLAQC